MEWLKLCLPYIKWVLEKMFSLRKREPKPPPPEPDIPKPRCLLVVEDRADQAALLEEYIKQNGFICDKTSTAEEALGLLRAKSYPLAFVDMRMQPRGGRVVMQGQEFISICADQWPQMRIVITLTVPEDLGKLPDGTRYEYIEKPVRARAIAELLKTV